MAKGPFMDVVRGWADKQRTVMNRTVSISLQLLYGGLTKGAPVLTGRFVFNFSLTENSPAGSSNLNYSPDRSAAQDYYLGEIQGLVPKAGGLYYITNTVVYAAWIEYNHPGAKGYIRSQLMTWDKIVQKAHKAALKEIFK